MTQEDPNPFAAPVASVERERSPVDDTELAERGERLGARIIDNVIVMGALIPGLVIALGMTLGGGTPSGDDLLPPPVLGAMSFAIVSFLGVTIYQWYLITTRGQTIGKRLLRLRVVKLDGRAVGFVDGVILREWVVTALSSLPLIGIVAGLVDSLMIFGADRRCLHDLIATTKVVRART
jgi:uncharacterized RDD family membrane protein YckC